jgi:protein-S-isoprenylcysteine O-methyltransferase Ste14
MPVVIMGAAILINFMNGFINGYWLANFSPEADHILIDIRIVIGLFIFLIGFITNQYHDNILISLRKNTSSGTYKIPYGGLFKYVSCPNYLGEIISWLGFCIVTRSLPALALLVWTINNLIPSSLDNQKWYQSSFKDYPVSRKAVFPYLL